MLKLGSIAPGFTARTVSGSEFALSDYLGSNVVLYFFHRAFTWG